MLCNKNSVLAISQDRIFSFAFSAYKREADDDDDYKAI